MESLFDDLTALKLDQSFADMVGVKKILTTVPVSKPNKQDFVRVHPAPECRLSPAALIELKDDRESYFLTPDMAANLPGEFSPCSLEQGCCRRCCRKSTCRAQSCGADI
jgi:hypothetical protein